MPSTPTLGDPILHPSKEFVDNPYPAFHQLRAEQPVFWSEKGKYWLVTGFAEAHHILRDVSYEKGVPPTGIIKNLLIHLAGGDELKESVSHWVALKNPPEHTRMRSTVNRAFTPAMITRMRPLIKQIADNLLDDLATRSEFDLISEFAFPLPVNVIATMLGVPPQDAHKLHAWSTSLTGLLEPRQNPSPGKIHKMTDANREFIEYLRPLIEERRREPKEDLISDLIRSQDSEHKLSDEELLANCVFLLVAGHETTVNLITNGVHALLTHPDQLDLLKSDFSLTPHAVEEILRFQSPIQIVRRIANHEMELSGKHLRKDDLLVLCLGACNRDPSAFQDPDRFDIQRKDCKHLAFGEGVHFCLGAFLARAEGDIALRSLFEKMPNLKLAQTQLEYKEPFALRGFKELRVSVN